MNVIKKHKIYTKRFFEFIKTQDKINDYYVTTTKDIANYVGIPYLSNVQNFLRRLELKDLIETKRSIALFGDLKFIGIKVLKEPNELEK
jgi:alkylated DNA nucleotide flippase Atl1